MVLLFISELKRVFILFMTGVPSLGLARSMLFFIFDRIGSFRSCAWDSAFCAIMPPAECATRVIVSNSGEISSSLDSSCCAFSSTLRVSG